MCLMYESSFFSYVITYISDQPVDKQHEILSDILDVWKGPYEQVDDNLIWGVRF